MSVQTYRAERALCVQAKGICDQAVRVNQAAGAIRNAHAALAHVSYHECKLCRIERCVGPVAAHAARDACRGVAQKAGSVAEAPWGLPVSLCGRECDGGDQVMESFELALQQQAGPTVLQVAGGERGALRRTLLVDASTHAMAHVYAAQCKQGAAGAAAQ